MLSFGGFLNSSFWSSYRSPSSTSIEEILNSKDCSVEKLLEDDDCLQEFKNLNEKLVSYFDHDKVKKLIDLITVMPPEGASHARGHKLPFIASEIFNCEINQILDKFFDFKEEPQSDDEEEVKQEESAEKKVIQKEQPAEESSEPEAKEVEQQQQKQEEAPQEQEGASQTIESQENQSNDQNEQITKEKMVEEESEEKTQTSTMMEPEEEDSIINTKKPVASRQVLLDRLFKFVKTDKKPLNPVLAGYFTKLVTILINRKQKQLIPYVFKTDSVIIDRLLEHVYSKSISELLNKFLNILDNDFDPVVSDQLKKKQQEVIQNLLKKLGPEVTEEDNLNGCSILQDMLETKEFYSIASKKPNVQAIVNYILDEQGTTASRTASTSVLITLCQQFHMEKRKGGSAKKKKESHGDEDDEMTLQHSDEEENFENQESPIVEVLKVNIQALSKLFETSAPQDKLQGAFDDFQYIPLGTLRLKLVELFLFALKLHKVNLYEAIVESEALANISTLLGAYPWNNFLQLKVISIYEEIFENNETAAFKSKLLSNSKICETLVKLAQTTSYKHESNRNFRHGYMAAVIKLGNFFVKYSDNQEVKNYIQTLGDDWKKFVEGELKKSNEINNRSLGGQQPRHSIGGEDDGDDNHYEVNMDKIMQRFTNFTTLVNSGSEDDEDEEKKESDKQIKDESGDNAITNEEKGGEEQDIFKHLESQQPHDKLEVQAHIEATTNLEQDYIDQNYWKTNHLGTSLDDLMADYQ